ncbi:MAG: hypothetical protein ACRDQU_01695 [Pseudonocardiaceae bacterium]
MAAPKIAYVKIASLLGRASRAPKPGATRPPDQLPVLTRGAHRRPEDGACVMEYVSVLAGSPFSDHPECTHPALAKLARVVNDQIEDDDVRSRLVLLAPDLAETGHRDARITPTLEACCLRAAAVAGQTGQTLQRLARVDGRLNRLERHSWARVLAQYGGLLRPPEVTVMQAFRLADARLRHLPANERDDRLSELLLAAVTNCRRLTDPPTAGAIPAPRQRSGRRHVG